MGALKATQRKAVLHACECKCVCECVSAVFLQFFASVHTCLHANAAPPCVCMPTFTSSPTCMAFNFEWRQMLCRPILRQWKEPFLSTYRSMSSHSIRKSETISTRLMTPFWKAGELWPRGRRVAGGGARKKHAGWVGDFFNCIHYECNTLL